MKSLSQHISEKLIINKNYKNVDDIETMFNNIEFERPFKNTLSASEDIFSIMVDYIRDHNVKSFSDFYSYRKTAIEDNDVCLTVFNKHAKDISIYQKMSDWTYEVFTIFKRYNKDQYFFNKSKRSLTQMNILKDNKVWNNINNVEYYEISKETFEVISKLYDELMKK